MSLYKYFGCRTKEELYNKVKSNDKSVTELISFLNYAKKTLYRKTPYMNSPNAVASFIKNFKAPVKDEFLLLFSDIKLKVTNVLRANLDSFEPKIALKEAFSNSSFHYILAYNSKNNINDFKSLKNALTFLGFINSDDFEYHQKISKYRSFKDREYYKVELEKNLNDFIPYKEVIPTFPEFKDFIEHYLKKETLGLSILNHAEKIKENLKVAFQDRNQEEMGIVIYDKNKDVIGIEKISLGSVDFAPARPKDLFNAISKYDHANGFVLFHNHPSGSVIPSTEDMNLTKRVMQCSIFMDFEMADHFILGKEGVYSFAQDGVFEFGCNEYNEILNQSESNVFEDLEFYTKEDEMDYSL